MENRNSIIGLLVVEAIMWGGACLGHYFGEKIKPKSMHLNAPQWVRMLFGDFREIGTLSTTDIIIQIFCYITIFIAFFFLLESGLTITIAIRLWFLMFFLTAIVIVLVRDIIPRFFKRNQ